MSKSMCPIFLIGYPGVGKSTIGGVVAERLGLRFVDTDMLVEARYHASVSSMIRCCGVDKFRKRERVLLLELLRTEGTLVATGGGLPLWEDNMDLMLEQGRVVLLDSPREILAERLYFFRESRPAVAGMSRTEVRAYLDEVAKKREPVYRRATLTVPIGHLRNAKEIAEAADRVIAALGVSAG